MQLDVAAQVTAMLDGTDIEDLDDEALARAFITAQLKQYAGYADDPDKLRHFGQIVRACFYADL